MVHLESDYNNGAHKAVLQHLIDTNDERSASYGDDSYSVEARERIRKACGLEKADIFFLAGGTQTNATIIDCVLQPYEGVVCCDTAHINVHESGAVEFTGHKVIALEGDEGKLRGDRLERWLKAYYADETAEHMVKPGMVYITFPTELGTLYSRQELEELQQICHRYDMPLYVDGARLAYGLAASEDVDLPTLAHLADVFYIGGTKCGALCGEAVVFANGKTPSHMLSRIKRHGSLLAKSRVVGVQFEALFGAIDAQGSTLYEHIGRHAVALAKRLRHLFVEQLGYPVFIDSPTNQQFYILPNKDMETLRLFIGFEPWCPIDDNHTACRFVTSWATTEEEVEEVEGRMKNEE